MKVRFILPLLLLFILAGFLISLASSFSFSLPWRQSRVTTVYTYLVETSQDSLLNSAEYTIKLLFPYDFIEAGDEVPWRTLQYYYNYDRNTLLLKESAEMYPDRIIPPEWKYASLYRMCRESGLDPAVDPLNFVVLEAVLKAGVILPSDLPDEREDFLQLGGRDKKNLTLILPAPEITDIIILDRPAEGYGYPEVAINPDQWSSLVGMVTPRIMVLAGEKGILEEAARGAAGLLTDLFEGAGFEVDNISFK